MSKIANTVFAVIISALLLSCRGQTKQVPAASEKKAGNSGIVGGPFENGEYMYIGMPDSIKPVDTSAGWTQKGQKLLITGTIYKPDGKTPAPGIILYYYHTDITGLYAAKQDTDPRVARHGYIRGWVKSDINGRYAIYTVRPAPYPNSDMESHIHPSLKEPGIDKEYYIDEFVFDDDSLLTGEKRKRLSNRGGSGILRPFVKDSLQIAEHNIITGLNIPNYPLQAPRLPGPQIGEDQPSFIPHHAFGPDKGSRACPVCKYGRYTGILYFAGSNTGWTDIKKWLTFLEQLSAARGKYLKVYFVYGNSSNYSKARRLAELEKTGAELNLKNIALTFVPDFNDTESEVHLNKIDPAAENTFVIYRNRTIIDKYINLKSTEENFRLLEKVSAADKGGYFNTD
jgi:protocatechuate 3,4-dioxygenase, beta subunit